MEEEEEPGQGPQKRIVSLGTWLAYSPRTVPTKTPVTQMPPGESAGRLATMAIEDAGSKKKKKQKKKNGRDKDCEWRLDDASAPPAPGVGSSPKADVLTPSKPTASKPAASKPGAGASATANPFPHGLMEYRHHHQWEMAGAALIRYRESLGITSKNMPGESDVSHMVFLKTQLQELHGLLAIQTLDGYVASFQKMAQDPNPKKAEKGKKYAKIMEAASQHSVQGNRWEEVPPRIPGGGFRVL